MAEWLQGLLRLVEHRPPVAGAWLASPDLDDDTARVRQLAKEADELATAEAWLAAEIPDWQQLDPTAAERLENLSVSSARTDPPLRGGLDRSSGDLLALTHAFDDAGEHIGQARHSAGLLAAAFEAGRVDDIALVAIDRLVELGQLAASDCPPEPDWFDEKGLQAASEALGLLSEIVPRYVAARDELIADFKPAVVELDLEELRERRDRRIKILGKIGRGYRADRATLAAATVSSKATGRTMRTPGRPDHLAAGPQRARSGRVRACGSVGRVLSRPEPRRVRARRERHRDRDPSRQGRGAVGRGRRRYHRRAIACRGHRPGTRPSLGSSTPLTTLRFVSRRSGMGRSLLRPDPPCSPTNSGHWRMSAPGAAGSRLLAPPWPVSCCPSKSCRA